MEAAAHSFSQRKHIFTPQQLEAATLRVLWTPRRGVQGGPSFVAGEALTTTSIPPLPHLGFFRLLLAFLDNHLRHCTIDDHIDIRF